MRNVLTAIRASKTVDRESGENKSIELLSRGSSLQHLLKAVENIQRQKIYSLQNITCVFSQNIQIQYFQNIKWSKNYAFS